MKRYGALLLCIALGACRIEVSEPLTAGSGAMLMLRTHGVDSPGVRELQLFAQLYPGGERGIPRAVSMDSLGIFGVMLAPELDRGAVLDYRHTLPLDDAWANADEPLRLPTPAGLEPQRLYGALRVLTTDLPDTVVVADELVLGLNRHGEYGPDDRWRWILEITADNRQISVFSVNAEAAPDTIRIPRSLLPDLEEAQLELRVDGLSEHDLLSGEYHVTIREEARITRILRFTDSTP